MAAVSERDRLELELYQAAIAELAYQLDFDPDAKALKFNPNHDEHSGQFTSGGSSGGQPTVTEQEAHALTGQLHATGGFSYRPVARTEPVTGYMVATHSAAEQILPAGQVTDKAIRAYAMAHWHELLQDPSLHIGAWEENGKVALDLSSVVSDLPTAEKMGRDLAQEGIYDIRAGQTIYLHARTDEAFKRFERVTRRSPYAEPVPGESRVQDSRRGSRGFDSGSPSQRSERYPRGLIPDQLKLYTWDGYEVDIRTYDPNQPRAPDGRWGSGPDSTNPNQPKLPGFSSVLVKPPPNTSLADGPISNVHSLGGGMNAVYKAEINGTPVIVKPFPDPDIQAQVQDTIEAGSEPYNEVAASLVAGALGLRDIVPEVVIRDSSQFSDAYDGKINVEPYIPNYGDDPDLYNADYRNVQRIALLDAVIGNADRHGGNLLDGEDGSVIAIDHGLSFPEASGPSGAWNEQVLHTLPGIAPRGSLIDGEHVELANDDRDALKSLQGNAALRKELESFLSDESLAGMDERINWMMTNNAYPSERDMTGRRPFSRNI